MDLKTHVQDVASIDLGNQCRATAARMVPHMLVRAADCDGTIRWLLRRNFPKVVLVDRLPAQMGHLQRTRLMHAKLIYMVNAWKAYYRRLNMATG